MSQIKCSVAVSVLFLAVASMSPGMVIAAGQQDDVDPPATHVEYQNLKTKLVNEFRDQPDLTLDEKADRIRRILELDTAAIDRLESGDAAYLADANDSSESLVSLARNGTIGSAFFLANLLEDGGRFAESAETLEYVVANSVKFYGENNWKTLEYQLKLGKAKWAAGATSDQIAKWAQAKLASSNGLAALRNNDPKTARELLSQAKSTLEELSLQNTMAYGEAVANLAEVVARIDTVEATEAAFQDAFEVNDGLFAKRSPTNASMRVSLAVFYSRNSMPQNAIATIEEAEEIFKTVKGEKSASLAQCLSLKGTQLRALKQYQEAQNQHLQAFAMLNELGQRDSQISLYVLNNMYELLSSLGQHKDAADVAQLAIPVAEAVVGKEAVVVVDWLNRGANSSFSCQNYEKAVEQFTAAKEFLESTDDYAKNRRYVKCLSGLAMTYYRLENFDQAIEIAGRASELSREMAGESSIDHLVAAQNLALFLTQNMEYEKANDVFVRILPLLKDSLGEANIDYQKTIFDHVTNLLRFDKPDAAIEQLTYLRNIQENSIGRSHPDFSTTLKCLADTYEQQGSIDLAKNVNEELAKIKRDSGSNPDPSDNGEPIDDQQ